VSSGTLNAATVYHNKRQATIVNTIMFGAVHEVEIEIEIETHVVRLLRTCTCMSIARLTRQTTTDSYVTLDFSVQCMTAFLMALRCVDTPLYCQCW